MAKVLVTDGMADEGVQTLEAAGHEVDKKSVEADELVKIIGGYDALVVRSKTRVPEEVLAAGTPRLKLVGRAGVGVDNIDLEAATQHGVIVINAPLGNIISAAEHTIGMIFAAARNIGPAHKRMCEGGWDKKQFVGVEVSSRTLGIIGLGKIGRHVAKVMKGAGMRVIAHDPFLSNEVMKDLGIEPAGLDELVAEADFISLHLPINDKTRGMFNAKTLAKMKSTARLVNVARGGIVDEADLVAALEAGTIGGAALDVFVNEPLEDDSPLRSCPGLVITPHLGASTEEAQVRVSDDVAKAFVAYFADGSILNAVNIRLEVDPAIAPYLPAAERLASALVQTIDAPLESLEVKVHGKLARYDTKPLGVAVLKGALQHISDAEVNLVNAALIAEERGIAITNASSENENQQGALLTITATADGATHTIGGTVIEDELRVRCYDDYLIDVPLGRYILVLEYPDRPGMVGAYGSILGENEINIARMEVSRIDGRGDALVILELDDPIPDELVTKIKNVVNAPRAFSVSV